MLGFVATIFSLMIPSLATPHNASSSPTLAELALQKVLQDAAPIFGDYETSTLNTSTWMKNYPDSTKLVHMNLYVVVVPSNAIARP